MDHQVFKERRERLGSQKAVAAELGIGESTIQSYENDRSEIPRTVELALEALEKRAEASEAKIRENFNEAVKRYARAFVNLHHDEMAQIWVNELAPPIQRANAKDHAEMRVHIQEMLHATARPLRVYDSALKNRGMLIKLREMFGHGMLERKALDEILHELG